MPTKLFDVINQYNNPVDNPINAQAAELVVIDLDAMGADVTVQFPVTATEGQCIGISLLTQDTSGAGHVVTGGGAVSSLPFPLQYAGDCALLSWDPTVANWVLVQQWHAAATGVTSAKTNFTNASLAAGVLTWAHNLNRTGLLWEVYDDSGTAVNPDLKLTFVEVDANTITLTLSAALLPISGSWSIQVLGGP